MTTDYGLDTWCDSSLKTGLIATGLRLVAQNAAHRLETPRGMLRGGEEEAEYGFDLVGKLGSLTSESEAAALPAQIRNELSKDKRILEVSARVTSTSIGAGAVEWSVAIDCTTAEGTFSLSVDKVTVQIVGLGGAE